MGLIAMVFAFLIYTYTANYLLMSLSTFFFYADTLCMRWKNGGYVIIIIIIDCYEFVACCYFLIQKCSTTFCVFGF